MRKLPILSLFNSLPNDKIIACSKFKSLADDKIDMTQNLKFVLERVENILGKGENADYQHFLIVQECYEKPSLSVLLKVRIVWLSDYSLPINPVTF